jgi:dihydrofolate reductase
MEGVYPLRQQIIRRRPMRKLIFSINMTLDGFIDHTAVVADDELHDRASDLLRRVDLILYGRIAYQLMAEYWPTAPTDPSLSPSVMEFANTINPIRKIVYSKTMESVSWNTRIVRAVDPEEIRALKRLPGKDILLGPGAEIAQTFMDLELIDEYRFVMQPIILGMGKRLFTDRDKRKEFSLVGQTTYHSGVVELIYQPKIAPTNS